MQPQRQRYPEMPKEFEEKVIQVNRVSKKTQGGNRIGFSVLMVVGDRKGKVGVGLGKARDVSSAIRKAVAYAKKHLIDVPTVNGTIPHDIFLKRSQGFFTRFIDELIFSLAIFSFLRTILSGPIVHFFF